LPWTSIRNKLTLSILLTALSVALLLTAVFVLTEIASFRISLVNQTATLARIAGYNNRQHLILNQSYAAEQVLAALAEEPTIRFAYIFDADNQPFAQYINSRTPRKYIEQKRLQRLLQTGREKHFFSLDNLTLLLPIRDNGHKIATIYLQTGLDTLYARLSWFGIGFGIIVACSLLTALLLSFWFQRLITHPITRLCEVMGRVSRYHDYQLRAEVTTRDEVGRLAASFNVMIDRLQAHNDELERHRDQLEDMVGERTVELEESNRKLSGTVAELELMRDAAEAANRAKSEFLATMSHEIRTPMVSILGMAELLRRSDLTERQTELATILCQSGESLLQILNDILDVSKIEAGKMVLLREAFSLRESIGAAADLMAHQAFGKRLELVCDIDPAIPDRLEGDAGRLRQILLNLIGNAVKFTEDGEVVVRLNLIDRHSTSVVIGFSVQDSGIGMSREEQHRVFDSFTQADGSTTRTFGGTGLGLTIVRQLVQQMGGEVRLQSAPGQGSTFSFDLELPLAPAEPGEKSPGHVQRARLLVVEDHPAAREMATRQLAANGYRMETAADAPRALEQLEQAMRQGDPFALALCDVTLPGMDGWLLARSIHNHPALFGTRVLLLAPPGLLPGDVQRHASDSDGLLFKPLDGRLLQQQVEEVLHLTDPSAAEPVPSTTERPAPCPGRNILLVEDNPNTQRLVEIILQGSGCCTTMANNGAEAVDLLEAETFDLILMDGQMPVMDGFTATRIIRQRRISTPIIALTANAQEDTLALCREAGMDDYLKKPFHIDRVQEMLEKWLPTMSADASGGNGCD